MGEGSQKPWFAVTFSQKTESLPLVKRLLPHLHQLGINPNHIFLQDNISDVDQESHWLSQWMGAQRISKVAVCLLTSSYLRSRPCCTEWKLIQEWQRLVVCTEDPEDMILEVELNGFNGPPLAHLQAEEQTLSMTKYSEEQLAQKIFEKYLANRDRSYEEDLRNRGAARRLSMGVGAVLGVLPSMHHHGSSPLSRKPSPTSTAAGIVTTTVAVQSSYPNSSSGHSSGYSSANSSRSGSPCGSPSGSPPNSPPRPASIANNAIMQALGASEVSGVSISNPSSATSPGTAGRHLIITPAGRSNSSSAFIKSSKITALAKPVSPSSGVFAVPKPPDRTSSNSSLPPKPPQTDRVPSSSTVGSAAGDRVLASFERLSNSSITGERLSGQQPSFSSISSRETRSKDTPSPNTLAIPKRSSLPKTTLPADVDLSDLVPSLQGFGSPPNLPSFLPPSPMCPPSLPQISPPPPPRVVARPPPIDDDDEEEEDGDATSLLLLSPFVSRMSFTHSPSHSTGGVL